MTDVILAIVGTRQCIRRVNAAITVFMEALDRETIIVTGDASGVDAHVKRECERLGFRFVRCYARKVDGKWKSLASGPERNTIISRLAQSVVAWPATPEEERDMSKGTWNCIDQFRGRGKGVVVREEGWRT